jgi:O-antigen/teichoic acid export membrane protein
VLRSSGRAIGFGRNIVLARLLSPEDIGVFGIALLILSILDRFSSTGLQSALVQKKGPITSYLNNVFSVHATRGLLIGLAVFLSAPFVVDFFAEPRALPLIRLLAVSIVLRGLQNPAMLIFQRQLAMDRQAILRWGTICTDLFLSIVFAIVLQNPLALMIGLVGGKAMALALSYALHPFRPRIEFQWRQTRELGRYGRWVFFSNALYFLTYRGDNVIVAKLLGPAALGVYLLAFRISEVVTLEAGLMLNDVAFPAYARVQDDLARLQRAFQMVTELVASIALPTATFLAVVSVSLTDVMLGDAWKGVGLILPVTAAAGALRALLGSAGAVLRGAGHPRLAFQQMLVGVCGMYLTIFPLAKTFGLLGVAMACLVGMLVATPVAVWQSARALAMRPVVFARICFPGLLLSAVVAAASVVARSLVPGAPALQTLVVAMISAGLGFTAVSYLLWRNCGSGPWRLIALLHKQFLAARTRAFAGSPA